jgi:hypothetical protein
LAGFNAHIASNSFVPGVYFAHPGQEKGGLAGLPGRMEHPVELIPNIPVQLGADKPFLRGQHIVPTRVAGTGGIKKSLNALSHTASLADFSRSNKDT